MSHIGIAGDSDIELVQNQTFPSRRPHAAASRGPLVARFRCGLSPELSCLGIDHICDITLWWAPASISQVTGSRMLVSEMPVLNTALTDPLKDEAQAYADQLQRAGTKVRRLRYSETIHGFLRFRGPLEAARTAALEIGTFVRQALGD